MAAMMFPAIIPMVLLYNRLISDGQNNFDKGDALPQTSKFNDDEEFLDKNKNINGLHSYLRFWKILKTSGFIGTYLLVWALTGIGLLIFWSILMNNLFVGYDLKDLAIVSGILLIISGIYQFTSLKQQCLGYCESPLSFFMKRWRGKKLTDGLRMGLLHGMYCLGCCWPYFLLMITLGWMNILWMGLFAAIIFVEKIWSKGIWISRMAGIAFMVIGLLSVIGFLPIVMDKNNMTSSQDIMNTMDMMNLKQDGGTMNMEYGNGMNMNMNMN